MDAIQKNLLEQIAGLHEVPAGAYNIRANGASVGRNTTAHIDIVTKEDKQQAPEDGKLPDSAPRRQRHYLPRRER